MWDRATGHPVMNAIVWQDRRTAGVCDELKARGLTDYVHETTGLVIDAYFSGTKISWILDHVPGARERAERGELPFGTVDSWLIWNLTGGAVHVTDYSNASRTMLFDINRLEWDERMLAELRVPRAMLPRGPADQRDLRLAPTIRCSSGPGSRSPPRSATSMPRCSARPVSNRAWSSPPTAPVPRC